MNANSLEVAIDIDYLMTNVEESKVTSQWMVNTYSHRLGSPETKRNWVEVSYREAKGWLGLRKLTKIT